MDQRDKEALNDDMYSEATQEQFLQEEKKLGSTFKDITNLVDSINSPILRVRLIRALVCLYVEDGIYAMREVTQNIPKA